MSNSIYFVEVISLLAVRVRQLGAYFFTQSFLDVWLVVHRKIRVINAASQTSSQSKPSYILIFVKPWVSLEYILGVSWPGTSKYIPDPSHSWVFSERFRCVYVMKGVWNLLTDMLFNRLNQIIGRKFLMKLQLCWATDFMSLEWVSLCQSCFVQN